MKIMKRVLVACACSAMLVSLAPAFGIFHQDPGDGGSGGGSWTVTCTYDGQERLISKSCTSGGTKSCNCP